MNMQNRAFPFLQINDLPAKPRTRGLTEIRGPYYTVMGERYLRDVLETMGPYVDSLKYAGGSFSLMSREAVRRLNDTAHEFDVSVSTGGFIEHVLTQGADAVAAYIGEAKDLGFDIIEVSTGFISLDADDWLRLIEKVQKSGLKAKPEIGIQFGAGGDTPAEELATETQLDVGWAVAQAKRFVEAGAYLIMLESEGITENVTSWRTDVPARFVNEVGLEKIMFEAADSAVFQWYIKNYGPDANLFVDHSQIVELTCIRAGIWGPNDLWGRVHTFRPERET
jgi:phosphosulfolactate synthase (CoM biosynthesis protein A)